MQARKLCLRHSLKRYDAATRQCQITSSTLATELYRRLDDIASGVAAERLVACMDFIVGKQLCTGRGGCDKHVSCWRYPG